MAATGVVEHGAGPRRPVGKERVRAGDERPQPRFHAGFFRRRLVDAEDIFGRQLSRQFLIGWREGGGGLVLQFDDPAGRTGLVQNLFQEQRDPPLALLEAAHQQGGEGDQAGTGLPLGYACRKFAAGADRTTRTDQPVQLVFGDQRLDLRNLPDLMPQGLGIGAGVLAARRLTGVPPLSLFGR